MLAAVALIVFGPDKLPQLAKDAARMLRTLRDMAQGARSQLNSELGPEFADFDLSSLNPRTAIRNALLGDEAKAAAGPERDEPPGGDHPGLAGRGRSRRSSRSARTGAPQPSRSSPCNRASRPVRHRRNLTG